MGDETVALRPDIGWDGDKQRSLFVSKDENNL